MDPVNLVIAALALGASAGIEQTTTAAVRDAYNSLKEMLGRRRVDIASLEESPDSPERIAEIRDRVVATSAAEDPEVVAGAARLTQALSDDRPGTTSPIGVTIRDLQAEFVKIGLVSSSGAGVVAEGVRVSGGFTVDEVHAGGEVSNPQKQ